MSSRATAIAGSRVSLSYSPRSVVALAKLEGLQAVTARGKDGEYQHLLQAARAAQRALDPEAAIAAYRKLAWHAPADPVAPMALAGLYAKLQRHGEAAAAARQACDLTAPDPARSRQLIQLQLRAGLLEAAAASAGTAEVQWPSQPVFGYLHGRALLAGGQAQAAAEHFATALAAAPDQEDWWAFYLLALQQTGNSAGHAEAAMRAADLFPGNHRYQIAAARRTQSLGHTGGKRYADRAIALAPGHGASLALQAEAALAGGDGAGAAVFLHQAALATPGASSLWLRLAELLNELNRPGEAAAAIGRVLDLMPDSPMVLRTAAAIYQKAGRASDAQRALTRYQTLRANRLPSSLEQGLRDLHASVRTSAPDPAIADWAWRRWSRGRELACMERELWNRQLRWGAQADELVFEWVSDQPDRMAEVSERITIEGLELVTQALAHGRGALIAGAHTGAMLAIPLALHIAAVPYRGLAHNSAAGNGPQEQSRISTSDRSSWEVLGLLDQTLDAGKAVLMFADSQNMTGARHAVHEGLTLTFNEIAPRLIARKRAASLFCEAHWLGERICVRFSELPEPMPGEALQTFVARYAKSYYAKVFEIFASGPENLRCRGGFWQSVR